MTRKKRIRRLCIPNENTNLTLEPIAYIVMVSFALVAQLPLIPAASWKTKSELAMSNDRGFVVWREDVDPSKTITVSRLVNFIMSDVG